MFENRLLGDRVLIEVIEAETKTASGLLLSVQADPTDMQIGKVVAKGPGKIVDGAMCSYAEVSVGDEVMFQYGKSITVEGKQYQLVTGDDVIMITKFYEDNESGA
jgi:chaperonin GroES